MVELLDLPNELILEIVRQVPWLDCRSLCLVNHRISALSTPFLYSTVRFYDNEAKLTTDWGEQWMSQFENLRSFTRLMLRRPDLASHVKHISFRDEFKSAIHTVYWEARAEAYEAYTHSPETLEAISNDPSFSDIKLFADTLATSTFKIYDSLEEEFVLALDSELIDEKQKSDLKTSLSKDGIEDALISIMLPNLINLEVLDIMVPHTAPHWRAMTAKVAVQENALFRNLRRLMLTNSESKPVSSVTYILPWLKVPSLREVYLHYFSGLDLVATLKEDEYAPKPGSSNIDVLEIRSSHLMTAELLALLSLPKSLRIFGYGDWRPTNRAILVSVPRLQEGLRRHKETLEELTLDLKYLELERDLRVGSFYKLKRLKCSKSLLHRDFVEEGAATFGNSAFLPDRLPASLEELVISAGSSEGLILWGSVFALASLVREGNLPDLRSVICIEADEHNRIFVEGLYKALTSVKRAGSNLGMDINIDIWFSNKAHAVGPSRNQQLGTPWGWNRDIDWEVPNSLPSTDIWRVYHEPPKWSTHPSYH